MVCSSPTRRVPRCSIGLWNCWENLVPLGTDNGLDQLPCRGGRRVRPPPSDEPGDRRSDRLAGLTFEPFLRAILLGKINLVLLALVVVDCPVVPARYRGMSIGFAAGIKILPGASILLLILKREWGAVGR